MIMLMKKECTDDTAYDYVSCPSCRSRLCDKPKNEKVNVIQVMVKDNNNKINYVVIKCRKCGNKYLISTLED